MSGRALSSTNIDKLNYKEVATATRAIWEHGFHCILEMFANLIIKE